MATAPNNASVDSVAGQLWPTSKAAWALVWVVTKEAKCEA
jgi:hypothetical protein